MELVLPDSRPVGIWLVDRSYGLPDLARPLLEARPAWAVPVPSGDTHVMARAYTL